MPVPADWPDGYYPIKRKATSELYHELTRLLSGLPRCSTADACPSSRAGQPCARDVIHRTFAAGVLDPKWEKGRMLKEASIGTWFSDNKPGGFPYPRLDAAHAAQLTPRQRAKGGQPAGPLLAEATTALLIRTYARYGQADDRETRARELLPRAIKEGVSDPFIFELWARDLARPSRVTDYEMALGLSTRS
jgi:hypothetical protein